MSTSITDLPYNPADGKIPERDIPRETIGHMTDPESKVQYVPTHQPYIPPAPTAPAPSLIARYIDEFRVPIVLSLLYYIFQLSFVQDLLQKFTPFLFKDDGGLTSYGAIAKSILFGASYLGLTTAMEQVA